MTIEEIMALAAKGDASNDVVARLKQGRYLPQPDVDVAEKALNPELHDIMSPVERPDKKVRVDSDENAESAKKIITVDGETTNTRTEKVARIRLAIQKLIIKRAVAFLFGNNAEYKSTPDGETQEKIMAAFNAIIHDVKANTIDRKVARSMFSYRDAAEVWFTVESKKSHERYGFPTKNKLRCVVLSPEFGDTLYPYFDDSGDMVAFSRSFSRKDADGKAIDYFETYTDTEHWLWVQGNGGFNVAEGYPKPVEIGKIPVVFGNQPYYETEDVDSLVSRLETLLSNFADTNDYHASPKIFVTGQINGWSKKGESGSVIEGEEGATMNYVSWQNAPESVKLEIETLLRMIYTITQTPDISFDSVKGLSAITGVALKLLFMDAHLKVMDKREIFDEYLTRRANIIKAFIGKYKSDWEAEADKLVIEPEITPYMLNDEMSEINMWLAANGDKPLVSHKESVKRAGLSANPDADFEEIQKQSEGENIFQLNEPTEA